MRELLIFDCDGTLVNTIVDVAICFNAALEECGFPPYDIEAYNGFVGGNLETIVSRLLPEGKKSVENIDRVKNAYRKIYSESDKPNTKPYPGICEMLDRLKMNGFVLTVNTNKGQQLTDALLAKIFKRGLFEMVVGYEEQRPSKPDPYGVDMICGACHRKRNNAIYIGDGKSDINTADNAKIPCILVTWGQTMSEDKCDKRVAHVVDNVEQLEKVLMDWYAP